MHELGRVNGPVGCPWPIWPGSCLMHRKLVRIDESGRSSGRGIVERFIDAGADVVIADVNDNAGQDLANSWGSNAHYHHVDVAFADDMSTLIVDTTERLGGLDVMVNNAGISTRMHRSFSRMTSPTSQKSWR